LVELVFVGMDGDRLLLFDARSEDGGIRRMNSQEVRQLDPAFLLDFYEKFIRIE
jgi:hypothetical protein